MPRRKRKPPHCATPTATRSADITVGTNLGALIKKASEGKKTNKLRTSRPSSRPSVPATQRPPAAAAEKPLTDPPDPPEARPPARSGIEMRQLNDAYAGVTPLQREGRLRTRRTASHGTAATETAEDRRTLMAEPGAAPSRFDEQARQRLDALVGDAIAFAIDTCEEGRFAARRHGVGPRELRRLRGPTFVAEATLDLHGAIRSEIPRAVTDFVRHHHRRGCRYLLLIHGKGLHSPEGQGVLGEAVFEALTRGGAAPLVRALGTPDERHGGRGATAIALG